MTKLRPAYPYFGSKAAVADEIWDAFGVDVPNFVDPFCGSASVLLARPRPGKIETLNDAHAFLPNFLRAVRDDPDAVADHAMWPVSEIDMRARHADLLRRADEAWVEWLREDPRFYDAEMAGWWVWGASIWIGSGWCAPAHRNSKSRSRPLLSGGTTSKKRPALGGHVGGAREGYPKEGVGIFRKHLSKQLPHLSGQGSHVRDGHPGPGMGIFRGQLRHPAAKGQLPSLSGSDGSGVGYGRGIFASGRREDLRGYFAALAERLQLVRITCGDWTRVVTPAVTISHGLTAVLLDPPYGADRTAQLYAKDSTSVAADACAWAIEHGDDPSYRIALCGYEGEHEMPASWHCHTWKAKGGYGNQDRENANAERERIWFSKWCLGSAAVAGPLYEGLR